MDLVKFLENLDELGYQKRSNPDIAKVYADVDTEKLIEKYYKKLFPVDQWQQCESSPFKNVSQHNSAALADPETTAENLRYKKGV